MRRHSSTTLTEDFPCFFLSCKANAGAKLAKMGHGSHSSKLVVICFVLLLFVLFYVMFVCKCVLYHCHRMLTQLQRTNIYHIIWYHIFCAFLIITLINHYVLFVCQFLRFVLVQ